MILKSIFVLLFYCHIGARKAQAEDFIIENSSPAIVGADVTFTVTVTNHTGELLRFWFYDGTAYSANVFSSEETFNHTVECKKERYHAGSHGFTLDVYRRGEYYSWKRLGSANITFTLTETLNGGPKMIQRGEDLHTDYVYPYEPVYHYLEIPHEEHMYLEEELTERLYYWYINCALVDVSRDFYILHTYRDAQETYDLRVVLVVKKKSSTTTTRTTTAAPWYYRPGWYDNQNSRTSERTSRRNYKWDNDQSSGTSARPSRTTERYNRGTSERTSRRSYNWDDDQSSRTSPRSSRTTERYNRGISERTSRRSYNWDDDQSSGTSPRYSRTTERYNRGTSERTSRRSYNWDDDQSNGTSSRPSRTTERYNRGTSERSSRRSYNWDEDQINGTSTRPNRTTESGIRTTTDADDYEYPDMYDNQNNRTFERTSRRNYTWDDNQNNRTSPAHNITKRGVYNGHYRQFDDGQCMPNIVGVFAYGVYDQIIHIIDRNNLPPTSTTTTSNTTSKPLIIPSPTTSRPPPPTPTTDKDRDTSVRILNPLAGFVSPFSISSLWSQKQLPKNINFRGILNMILKGSFNIEYSETQEKITNI